ncbi:MAG: hypothetical protein LBF60_09870 [Treponema sp.]|jgi:transposase-like protein|nr:hypothetical protein [Treponema sp.]
MALQMVKSGVPMMIRHVPINIAEYAYNGCKADVKKSIIKWTVDGAGIRATARELGASADRVIKEIKIPLRQSRRVLKISH